MDVLLAIRRPNHEEEIRVFKKPTELTIGRGSNCKYRLDSDIMASRMHAVILIDPPSVSIRDLNSTNGLIINGDVFGGPEGGRLLQPRALRDGDEVVIGSTIFHVQLREAENIPPGSEEYSPAQSAPFARYDEGAADRGGTMRRERPASAEDTVSRMVPFMPELPGYVLKRMLGMGKAGAVFQATRIDDGEAAAVRVIAPLSPVTVRMRDAFEREMSRAKQCNHRYLARILDFGMFEDKGFFLASEYVNGGDLEGYLRRCAGGRMPLRAAYSLLVQISSVLGSLHGAGIVHHGVKPASVLLARDRSLYQARLSDTGLAPFLEEAGFSLKTSGSAYAPPEQWAGCHDAKPNQDVYAAAAIFHHMFTGLPPPQPHPGHPISLPEVPEALARTLTRCLSRNPEERYQDCIKLTEALENAQV